MSDPTRLVLSDPTDALGRKVVRLELSLDKDLVFLDLPRRYAGHATGNTKFTEPNGIRALGKEEVLYLIAWLTEAAEILPDA